MRDYFEFWTKVSPDARMHPDDEIVFARLGKGHGFDLKCLPLNFSGPLKTARVVLLYLSPGLGKDDGAYAATPEEQAHISQQRTGMAMLPGDASALGHKWRKSRLKFLGDWESERNDIAIMNISAYHSKDFLDHDVLASLPSSRAALDWAQSILFPEAEAGKRVVICMRAARYWGLRQGEVFGVSLFAPKTNRGGHMLLKDNEVRDQAIRAARKMLLS